MLTAIDHIIIGTNNLEETATRFNQKLGLIASGGGKHSTGGTANRIIVIGDTYLELIALHAPEEAQPSMRERLAKGDGYLNFVLASNNIQSDSQALKERGVAIIGPNHGELKSSDERARSWQRTDIERPDLTQHYPFIIQHDSSGKERRFRLAGWHTPPVHPLGAIGVRSTTLAVEDLTEATQRFQHIYGLQASAAYSGANEGWDATLVSFQLGEGGQSFELAAPGDKTRDAAATYPGQLPASDALRQHLQRFGESLCRMTLVVENILEARRFLDKHEVIYTYRDYPEACLWIHSDQACGVTIVLRGEK